MSQRPICKIAMADSKCATSSGPLAGVSGAHIVGRAPGTQKNPIADVDLLIPLTEHQISQYNTWLRTLIEYDLDIEDAHSICAHCRYGELGIVGARDLLEKVFKKEHLLSEDYMAPGLLGFDPAIATSSEATGTKSTN